MIKRSISFTQSDIEAVLSEAQEQQSNFGEVVRVALREWLFAKRFANKGSE